MTCFLTVLLAWFLLSVPIGIAVGHFIRAGSGR